MQPNKAGAVTGSRLISVGTDITEVARIEDLMRRHGAFAEQIFTPGERAYCGRKRYPQQHFADRFAVKESVMKAVGRGWLQGIEWQDIETVVMPGGAPSIRAHGTLAAAMQQQGIASFAVSLSHCRAYAIATVIALA